MICFLFVCFILVLEYFCLKYLLTKDKFTFIFALKYFVVCSFTVSFYFLLLVGLTYLTKMIEKETFKKYQLFKICLSSSFALIVLFMELIVESDVIAVQFFVTFFVVLLVHVASFVYLDKVMFSAL